MTAITIYKMKDVDELTSYQKAIFAQVEFLTTPENMEQHVRVAWKCGMYQAPISRNVPVGAWSDMLGYASDFCAHTGDLVLIGSKVFAFYHGKCVPVKSMEAIWQSE
jgi:hypothetical protein